MKKIKLIIILLLHFLTFLLLEMLIYYWKKNNDSNIDIFLTPVIFYLIIGFPIYLIFFLFYKFIIKINLIINKIIWFFLVFLFVCFTIIGVCYCIYLFPYIPDDGDEGFALIYGSFALCLFLIGFTSFILMLSKKILNYTFKIKNQSKLTES